MPVLPAQTPVALDSVPEPDPPPMFEAPEEPEIEVPIAAAAASPRRERRRVVRPSAGAAGAPAQAAADTQDSGSDMGSDDSVIGDLTAGGESTPQTKQEAEGLLKDNDRRLKLLPESLQRAQRSQVSKVKNFQRQAQQALKSGDSEGAKMLALKAKLLLDDFDK